ncbi:hypothetical protein ACU4GA_10685 [Methylobacterium oryzae CBMB20]
MVGPIVPDCGHLGADAPDHATAVFGGATAATMIRFPFSVILHGRPWAGRPSRSRGA